MKDFIYFVLFSSHWQFNVSITLTSFSVTVVNDVLFDKRNFCLHFRALIRFIKKRKIFNEEMNKKNLIKLLIGKAHSSWFSFHVHFYF